MFRAVWILSDKRSYISRLPLGGFSINFCAHVLSKKQFPHFRLYLGAIRLLATVEHNLWDAGTEEQRVAYSKEVRACDWAKMHTLEEELRVLYADTFPKQVGTMIMKYSKQEVSDKIASLNMRYLDTFKWIPTDTRERIGSVLCSVGVGQR